MRDVIELQFARDHPVAAGHFPGDPIIPGALLLDAVLQAVGLGAASVRSAKFLRPLRPGERMLVRSGGAAGGAINFECRLAADDALLATGVIAPA